MSASAWAVPRFGVVSSVAAPILLIGGWSLAAALQATPFDSTVGTISALAALDADHRWVMTVALAGVGLCHVVTSWSLRGIASAMGRGIHALGGVATIVVAAVPLPAAASEQDAPGHSIAAGVAFVALALWPAFASQRHAPAVLRPIAGRAASALLLGLVGWFGIDLVSGSATIGLSERIAAGAQAIWPATVVIGTRFSAADASHGTRQTP
jgi:hypothetical membrane protein